MMRGPIYWEFVLVTRPFETIRVIRVRNGRKDNIHGTYPRGFSCMLGLGDKVFVKRDGKRWIKMFEIMLCPTGDYPAIHYGRTWGPFPNQYRALKNLKEGAFLNAGIDPSWNQEPS
jgi:hypothetical protein